MKKKLKKHKILKKIYFKKTFFFFSIYNMEEDSFSNFNEGEEIDETNQVSAKIRQERIKKRKPNPQCFLSSKKFAEKRFGQISKRSLETNIKWHENDSKANKNGERKLIVLDDGTEYVGEWKNNLRHGIGKHYTSEGYYDGSFVDDMYEGDGHYFLWNDKTNCERPGEWAYYSGNWFHGKMHGFGHKYELNGDDYDGEFKNGKKWGRGEMRYQNGDTFDGDWENDFRSGEGKLIKANGDIFEGEFKDNKRNGPGILKIKETKRRLEGVWIDDMFKGGSYYDEPENNNYVKPNDISGKTDGLIPKLGLKNPDDVISNTLLN